MGDHAVTQFADRVEWIRYAVLLWVALSTVCIQIGALPTQIPPAVWYEMTHIKTIEDLLHMLDQTDVPGQDRTGNGLPQRPLSTAILDQIVDDNDDDDSDDDDSDDDDRNDDDRNDEDDDDEDDNVGHFSTRKDPVVAESKTASKIKLTLLKFDDVEPLPRCIPREAVVRLEPSQPHVIFWPGCVTIQRCGGCCNNDLFECQATQSEIVQRTVVEMEYTPRSVSKFNFGGVVSKNISQDVNCSCQCKVKPKDCNPVTQMHHNCRCECRAGVVNCPPKKHWDPNRCRCTCSGSQSERSCPKTRQEWDDDTCGCTCRKDLVAKCRPPYRLNRRRCKCERRFT